MKIESLLETVAECIRSYRRRGPKFPTPFDLSHIVWDNEHQRISMTLIEDEKPVKYDMYMYLVDEHGEFDRDNDDTESNDV